MPSTSATRYFHATPRLVLIIAVALLTTIFWANALRFYPRFIDKSYDDTSEQLVIGRLARSAADGITSGNATLGHYVDLKHPDVVGLYDAQKRYFENPRLLDDPNLTWEPYRSHFGLQGTVFFVIDLIDPLPRNWRVGFYHFLASLFTAGVLVWIADILRRRFGWPAFYGFLIPIAIEPMFPALAPSLYWVVATWFVPMAIAMHLADEDNPRRRFCLIAALFVAFLVKSLCGYEFVPTVIVAAAVGCMLGIKERPDRLARMLSNAAWTVSAGVAGFVVAILAHAVKEGGFAVIVQRAALRISGDSPSLQDELIVGKYVSLQSVVFRYFEGNDVTLVKNFGIPLGLFVLCAILSLMDKKIIWYLGDDRRKLHICALAFLASLAAPLSWIVLAKGHSFVHPHISFILWYLPTIPLAGALAGLSLNLVIENRSAWRTDFARSAITIAIPTAIVLVVGAIYVSDRLLQSERTWVVAIHAKGIPIFQSEDLGLDFRMTDDWFTLRYDCDAAAPLDSFVIRAYDGDKPTDYSFRLRDRKVYERKYKCFYAQGKADRPISRIAFGTTSKRGPVWQREEQISLPGSFVLDPLTDADWDRGVNRATGTDLLVPADTFSQLLLRKGDRIQFASSEQRRIVEIATVALSKLLTIDAPIKPADIGTAPIRIIRQ